MAQNNNGQQDNWNTAMSQWREAMEHNITASRLAATGALALGAAAAAYFWDAGRRNAFMDASRRWTGDMGNWWGGGSGSNRGGGGGGETAATGTQA